MLNENSQTTGIDLQTIKASLADAATELGACAERVDQAIGSMQDSTAAPHTKGMFYRGEIRAKVEALRKLTLLCDSASTQLMAVGDKLVSGAPCDEVLGELLAFNRFLGDQLQSEHDDACRMLSMLRSSVPA